MADVFAYLYGFGAGGDFTKSVIIVTAPTGSTVTCTKGTIVKTATEKNGEWWFKNLDTGKWTLKATLSGQTATQTVNITQFSVYRVSLVYRLTPEFTYTGSSKIVNDNDQAISDFPNYKGNWKIKFLTSGTFKVTNMYGWDGRIDLFLVGGGGGGGKVYDSSRQEYEGGGGGGGYTATKKLINVSLNTGYKITIGSGGAIDTNGGNTSAFGYDAAGGKKATKIGGDGGSGGGNSGYQKGGNGGSDGSDGATQGDNPGGNGQGTTTREFGESSGNLYAGGGGGGANQKVGGWVAGKGGDGGGADATKSAVANTGGGGGGSSIYGELGGAGGSGIVIIRNAR